MCDSHAISECVVLLAMCRSDPLPLVDIPNQWIWLLAGTTKMRVWLFVVLNVGRTVARVVAIWILGDVFADPLLAVNEWIGVHRLQLTLLTFALVAVGVWRSTRTREHPIETPPSSPRSS
jgi:hypothetical protein